MSEVKTKHAIRIMLPINNDPKYNSLESKLKWLEYHFGVTDYIDYNEDKTICSFSEDFEKIKENNKINILKDNKNNFALESIFDCDETSFCESLNMSLNDCIKKAKELIIQYNIFDLNNFDTYLYLDYIKIVSYNWYTGTDDPYVYGL